MTPAAALRLLDQAEASHKRALWRLAARALGEIVRAAEKAQDGRAGADGSTYPARPRRPQAPAPAPKAPSLIAYLAEAGLRDPGGELRGRDLDRWHKEKPFRRRLVREDGAYSLEQAAECAWEAGFFPNAPAVAWGEDAPRCPVTVDTLIAALEREAAHDFKALYPDREDAA